MKPAANSAKVGSSAKVGNTVQENAESQWIVFGHAVAFVFGFSLVFVLLGSAAGLLGRSLTPYMPALQRLGALLLVVFALTTLGFFRWLATLAAASRPSAIANLLVRILEFPNRMLYTEKRVTDMSRVRRNWGYLSSTLFGVTFAAGWTPCIGPILATILFIAGDTQTAWQGRPASNLQFGTRHPLSFDRCNVQPYESQPAQTQSLCWHRQHRQRSIHALRGLPVVG